MSDRVIATEEKSKDVYAPIDYFEDLKRLAGVCFHFPVWIGRLLVSSRVPNKVRLRLAFTIGYILLPFGIHLRKRPILGHLDDYFMALYALNYIFENVPRPVQQDLWGGNEIDLKIIEDLITEAFQMLTGRQHYLN